jgi:hypothetical protein
MVNFRSLKRIAEKAKEQVERRGGTGALKEDAEELKSIAKGEGGIKDKAKAAGEALKEPGAREPEESRGQKPPGQKPPGQKPPGR